MNFIFGGNTNLTHEQIQKRREMAQMLLQQGQGAPRNVGEGIYSAAGSIAGALMRKKAEKADAKNREEYKAKIAAALGGAAPSAMSFAAPYQPEAIPEATPQPAPQKQTPQVPISTGSLVQSGGGISPQDMAQYRNSIGSIESAGSGGYSAIGPNHPKYGRALGKYQMMEANLPQWTQAALGRQVSAQEFLASPEIQDAVFDDRFGGYVQKYGPQGAAQAWFGGEGGVGKLDRKDSLGTSIGGYTDKFNSAMGNPEAQYAQAPSVGANMDMGLLMELYSSPYASEGERMVLGQIIQQRLTPADPMRQLQLESARLANEKVRRGLDAAPERKMVKAADGYMYYTDTNERVLPDVVKPEKPGFRLMTPDEAKERGLDPKRNYQIHEGTGKIEPVEENPALEKTFDKETGKGLAKEAQGLADAGITAQRNMGRIDRLDALLQKSPQGVGGWFVRAAGNMGIQIGKNASDLQAAQALINSMVPEQRPPGSGPMSDADLALFKESLPRIINTPEGNAKIIASLRGIAQYDMQMGEIARKLQTGEITQQQYYEMQAAMENPLSWLHDEGYGEKLTPEQVRKLYTDE